VNLLDLIPGFGLLRSIGVALMVGGASTMLGGLFYFQPKGERIGEQLVRVEWAAAELRRTELALRAEQHTRADEQRQAALQREAIDEAQRLAARSRAGVAGAARADRVLSDAIAATVAGTGLRPKDHAAAGSCPAADPAVVVLADVLGSARARLRELGEFADQAHDAGLTCERAYDAVTSRADLTVVSGTAAD